LRKSKIIQLTKKIRKASEINFRKNKGKINKNVFQIVKKLIFFIFIFIINPNIILKEEVDFKNINR